MKGIFYTAAAMNQGGQAH